MSGNTKDKRQGYTLLEILVVLALLSIILSTIILKSGIIYSVRERNELNTFRRDILFARNSAIVENCFYILSLDENNNSYIIKKQGIKSSEQDNVKTIKFKNGLVLDKNHDKKNIKFYSTGSPDRGNTIRLTNRKKEVIEVSITPATGSVRLKINK